MKLIIPIFICLITLYSCGGDDDPMTSGEGPVSSFQFEKSTTNFLEVSFMNFSLRATSYSWDFGDGNNSTEENPIHIYAAPGDYTVTLTASNGSESRTSSKLVEIEDPNALTAGLHGGSSKVWKLSRDIENEAYPLIVGPIDRSQIWWALGLNEEIGVRPCIMEEEYIFSADNTFEYKTDGTVWGEDGVWDASLVGACVDENDSNSMRGPNGEDLSAFGSGTFTYNYDVNNSVLTLSGIGAHIGITKVGSNGDIFTPQASVTYNVISLETEGAIDKMVLEVEYPGELYWRYNLVSYDNPLDEPDLGGAKPLVSFTYETNGNTVTFTNASELSDSYAWDFGDGNMSTEENPTHTYAEDGIYTVSLTGTNVDGSTTVTSNVVIANNSTFTVSDLSAANGKVWKLYPIAGALSVGPMKSSGEWFSTSADDVTNRSCTFDDTYTFFDNGDFVYETNGDLWAEGYMGVTTDGCIIESELPSDAQAWGSGTHSFTTVEGMTGDPSTITVTGTGAFIGLPKAYNGGEYTLAPPISNGSIRYEVVNYINSSSDEALIIAVDISENQDGTGWWTFILKAE